MYALSFALKLPLLHPTLPTTQMALKHKLGPAERDILFLIYQYTTS